MASQSTNSNSSAASTVGGSATDLQTGGGGGLGQPQPPKSKGRNIVLCFDGTSNTFNKRLTNIPTLYSLLTTDPDRQVLYYQTGVGTYEPSWSPPGFKRMLLTIADFGVAWDLHQHVKDGYTYLMNTYKKGDKIYLFGFSRGAYTARALAGMVQQVGILLPNNDQSVDLAFTIYQRKASTTLVPAENGNPALGLAQAYKRDFGIDVDIHYVGVFDTVSSVGVIIPRTLPFANGNKSIRYFRHAISLDERRARFASQPWVDAEERKLHPHPHSAASNYRVGEKVEKTTDVKEVHFAGDHNDQGGGNTNTDDGRLPRTSNLSLRWLLRESMNHGLLIDEARLFSSLLYSPLVDSVKERIANKESRMMGYLRNSQALKDGTQSELAVGVVEAASRELSKAEMLVPRHDSLDFWMKGEKFSLMAMINRLILRVAFFFWWFLEIIPTMMITWSEAGYPRSLTWVPNFGRGRPLPRNPVMHESVRSRIQASLEEFPPGDGVSVPETGRYHPAAQLHSGDKWEDLDYVY